MIFASAASSSVSAVLAAIVGVIFLALVIVTPPKRRKWAKLLYPPAPPPPWRFQTASRKQRTAAGVAGLFALAAVISVGCGFASSESRTVELTGGLSGLAFAIALVSGFSSDWRSPLVCGLGTGAGFAMALKPVLFPIVTESLWKYGPGQYPLSIDAESHLWWLLPGLLLMVLSGLLYVRYRNILAEKYS